MMFSTYDTVNCRSGNSGVRLRSTLVLPFKWRKYVLFCLLVAVEESGGNESYIHHSTSENVNTKEIVETIDELLTQ